jgi:hypothetical protein
VRPAEDVLHEFADRRLPGFAVAEEGQNYLILRPRKRHRYGAEMAVLLGIVLVLAILILTAITPVFIALLPIGLLPAIPVLLDNRPDLAISAVPHEDGGTRVTVHGLASPELAAALDAYLGSLPRFVPPAPAAAPQPVASRAAGSRR